MITNDKEYIFVEKYRPQNLEDIVLPDKEKAMIQHWINDKEIPNLLLSGRIPGTGKTSLTHVLIKEIGADALFINASLESNIETLRTNIQGFVSTASFDGRSKIVVLDEADFLNSKSTQPALRGFIESFSKNARFILTCNYKNKLIEPLRNRLIEFDFDEIYNNNKQEMLKKTAKRTIDILKNENIKYEKEDLLWLLKHLYPSNRRIINTLQEYSTSGTLVINKTEVDQDSLNQKILEGIIKGDFETRKLISKLPDPSSIFSIINDHITDFPLSHQPEIIIMVGKWQFYDSNVRDRTINAIACCTEIMQVLK